MNRIWLKLLFLSSLIFALVGPALRAQVVASGMTGTVLTADGAPVGGAIVTAVHLPTNTTFTAVTGSNGRFSFRGMPVGGPYKVTATDKGQEVDTLNDVQTSLGEDADVALIAKSEVVQLEKLVTTASRTDLDANATGASSVLTRQRITVQPSVTRGFADLMKTNPFVGLRAGEQATALGINSRYNSIMLDGAKINDSFGLNSTGLFSLRNPFSFEAIEQVNISLTPYDVRQSGSAGLTMNVVSKSGTNEFHGSVYDYFTDQNWQGPDISGTNAGNRSPLKERTYGLTLGGPIWRDHLFFFVNFEKFIRDSAPTNAGFTPTANFLSSINTRLGQLPGTPDMGTFGGASTSRLADTKRMAKLTWNISDAHRLSVRYSDTIGAQPNFGSFNATAFSQAVPSITGQPSSFTNRTTSLPSNFYTLNVKEHVWAAQLFSDWTPELKTQFSYSNTKQDSVRSTPVIFPEIRILNQTPADANAGIPVNSAFRFGTETSSQGNELHVKTQTLAGSGDYLWRDFTFTIGADAERSEFFNLFRNSSYGLFDYNNITDFQNDRPFAFVRAVIQDGFPTAEASKFQQTGVFAQTKWEPIARLNLIAGLRVDYLGSPIAPPENAAFKRDFGVTNAGTIDGTTSPAPRFSFNYALDAKRMTQIRGGVGVFLGRNPWVWISNSYGQSGVGRFNLTKTVPTGSGANFPDATKYTGPTLAQYLNGTYSNSDSAYKFDPSHPIGTTAGPASTGIPTINLIKPGMSLPTIERHNIAVDRKLPFLDAVATVEYIETDQLSALFVDNMNLKPTTTGADGRQRFAGSSSNGGVNAIDPAFGNVIRTRSIHAGKSEYTSIGVERPLTAGWGWSVAYTRGHATEAQTLNSSRADSQWQFNPVFNQNRVEVSRSDYEVKDRFQASMSREFRFRHDLATVVSLYYEGRTGLPYSIVYANDLNNDGFITNDLVAVPTADDPRFDFSGLSAAQRDAYVNFFKQIGLSKYAGGYAPRNALLTRWQNRLDLHVEQQLPAVKGVRLSLFADFLNFGSFFSRSLFNYVYLPDTSATNGGQVRALGTATYTSTGLLKPTVLTGANNEILFTGTASQLVPNNSESRWKVQAGASLHF